MTTWYNLAPQPNWQEWLGVTVSANPSSFAFSAEPLTDTITVATGNNYFTGKAVMVSSIGGVLPAPLNASSVYYIIFISSNSYKLAATYANALAGTAIDLTTSGTGTLNIISTGVVYLQPNANGKIYTYSSLNHGLNKATYTDWTGNTENTNPIILDSKGQAVIYWAVNSAAPDDNYYIEIYTADDVLLYTRDNFNAPPGIESGGDVTTSNPINLLLNNEFDFWGMYDYGIDDITNVVADVSVIPSGGVETAYYWWFNKSNNAATDTLTRVPFPTGQTDVPNTPVYYMQAACTSAGSGGETFKYLYQKINNVQNFAAETVTFSFWARSATNGVVITPAIYQNFGSGGSSEVQTQADDITLTTTWTLYTSIIEVPSLNAKNVQDGSYVACVVEMPINSTYTVSLANTQLTVSSGQLPYRQLSSDERFSLLDASRQEITGTIKVQAFGDVPETWVLTNSNSDISSVGNASSNATVIASPRALSLFTALWGNYNDSICPVFTSDGEKTTRGATALEDFNDNVQIQLFFAQGRVITDAGNPITQFVYTAQIDTANTITINGDSLYANATLYTGVAVDLRTTGTVPGGLALSTTYYIIVDDALAGVYQLAASLSGALSGTAIVITSAGTGIQTLIPLASNYTSAVSGQAYGQSAHLQTIEEMPAHTHNHTAFDSSSNPVQNGFSGAPTAANPIAKVSTSTGGGGYMNVTQPTLALPHIIKL